ncbi:MAG: hypothetical protein ACJ8ER_03470 [Allosphingosinicella sp.]
MLFDIAPAAALFFAGVGCGALAVTLILAPSAAVLAAKLKGIIVPSPIVRGEKQQSALERLMQILTIGDGPESERFLRSDEGSPLFAMDETLRAAMLDCLGDLESEDIKTRALLAAKTTLLTGQLGDGEIAYWVAYASLFGSHALSEMRQSLLNRGTTFWRRGFDWIRNGRPGRRETRQLKVARKLEGSAQQAVKIAIEKRAIPQLQLRPADKTKHATTTA